MNLLKKIGSIIYKAWMAFANALGLVSTAVFLTLFYLIVIGPIAFIVWLARRDFLERRFHNGKSYWRERELTQNNIESAERQF